MQKHAIEESDDQLLHHAGIDRCASCARWFRVYGRSFSRRCCTALRFGPALWHGCLSEDVFYQRSTVAVWHLGWAYRTPVYYP